MFLPDGFGSGILLHTITGDSEPMGVTFGFTDQIGGASLAELQTMAAAIVTSWHDNVIEDGDGMTTDWVFLGGEFVLKPNGSTVTFPYEVLDGTVGTVVAESLPINAAVLVRKNTGFGGRKGQGRWYLPTFTTTANSVTPAGSVDVVHRANLEARFDAFLADLDTAGVDLVLLHNDDEVTAPHKITSLTVANKLATQRRRLRP